jgi:hypothetical protein
MRKVGSALRTHAMQGSKDTGFGGAAHSIPARP